MGGGGHMNMAGCQMADMNVEQVIDIIKQTLDTMIDNGELNV